MLSHFSHVQLFVTLWTIGLQAPLSMGFSRQEYWSELPCPPPGNLPDPGMEPMSLCLLHWEAGSLPLGPTLPHVPWRAKLVPTCAPLIKTEFSRILWRTCCFPASMILLTSGTSTSQLYHVQIPPLAFKARLQCYLLPVSSVLKELPPFRVSAAAAKSLQSCPTLCNPIDGSPPGSPVPGILQARTSEWVAISFSNAWQWKVKVKSLGCVRLLVTPWTAAHQAPLSMGFSRQEYCC